MENNKKRNYGPEGYNYPDIPHPNLDKSELINDLNQEPPSEGLEEFTSDQPNRFNEEDRNENTPNSENDYFKTDKKQFSNDFDFDDENYQDAYRRNPLRRDRDL